MLAQGREEIGILFHEREREGTSLGGESPAGLDNRRAGGCKQDYPLWGRRQAHPSNLGAPAGHWAGLCGTVAGILQLSPPAPATSPLQPQSWAWKPGGTEGERMGSANDKTEPAAVTLWTWKGGREPGAPYPHVRLINCHWISKEKLEDTSSGVTVGLSQGRRRGGSPPPPRPPTPHRRQISAKKHWV